MNSLIIFSMKITSNITLQRALKNIEREIIYADLNYKTSLEIDFNFSKYKSEARRTWRFWGMTRDNFRDQAVLSLCRIYDVTKTACSLPNILTAIKRENDASNRKSVVSIPFGVQVDSDQLKMDISSVSRTDATVQRLGTWRDKVIAHTDGKYIVDEKSVESPNIPTYADMPILIDRAIEITNHYAEGGRLFRDDIDKLVPKTDLGFIFTAVQSHLVREREPIVEEAKRLGIDPNVIFDI